MDVIAQVGVFEIVDVAIVCGDAGAVLLRAARRSKVQGCSRRENDGDNLSRGSHSGNGQLSQSVTVDRGAAGTRALHLAEVVRERVPKSLSSRVTQVVDTERLERQPANHARSGGTDTVSVAVIVLVRTRQCSWLKICTRGLV